MVFKLTQTWFAEILPCRGLADSFLLASSPHQKSFQCSQYRIVWLDFEFHFQWHKISVCPFLLSLSILDGETSRYQFTTCIHGHYQDEASVSFSPYVNQDFSSFSTSSLVIQFNNYFVVKYVIFFQRPNTFRNSLYSSIFPLSYWYSSKSNVTRTPLILGLPIAVLKQPRSNSSGQRQWWQWGRAHCHLHTTMFIGKILGLGLEIQDYACKGQVFV